MDEQQLREIAEAAFKRQFSDIEIVRINIRQRIDHDDDPVVDVDIYYDDECGQGDRPAATRASRWKSLTRRGGRGRTTSATPWVHLLVKAGLNQRDPVTV